MRPGVRRAVIGIVADLPDDTPLAHDGYAQWAAAVLEQLRPALAERVA